MAETIAIALVNAGFVGATAAGVSAAFTYAAYAYAAYSMYDGQKQARRQRDAARASITDRLVTTRSSAAASRIVYGRTRVAADTIAYIVNHGPLREYVTLVLPLAAHEVDAIEDVWFNDESIGPLSIDGYVTGGKYYRSSSRSEAESVPGGAVSATSSLQRPAERILSVADSVPTWENEGGPSYTYLTEGLDYSLSGSTITWLTNQAGRTLVVTYMRSAGAELVRVKKYLGIAAGERDTDLESVSGGEWTSAHLGKGIARLHVTLKYDNDVFGTIGIPNITAIVRGKKVYDWVSGVTAWSNNAALCTIDYLRSAAGFGIPVDRFSAANVQAAQTACDERVPSWSVDIVDGDDSVRIRGPRLTVDQAVSFHGVTGGALTSGTTYYIRSVVAWTPEEGHYTLSATQGGALLPISANGTARLNQARYTVDGVLSTDANRRENLKLLVGAMGGKAIYSGGQWRLRCGVYSAPVAALDETDLADGGIQIIPVVRRSDLFNGVRGTFPDPQKLYQTTSYPPYLSATFATEDRGQSIAADVTLALTQDAMRAQRLAKLMLFEHRQSLRFSANWKLRTIALQPGDAVEVSIARYGWVSKEFVVGEREMSPTGVVKMTLVETTADIYDWDYDEATNPDPAPNTSLPDPNYVARIQSLTFTTSAQTYTQLSDGSIIPYGVLSWPAITAAAVLERGWIEVVWKRAHELSWQTAKVEPDQTQTQIAPLSAGEVINVIVYVYNGAGVRSAAYVATFVCSEDLPGAVNVTQASGNLIPDASFAADVMQQWRIRKHPSMIDPVTWQKDPAIPGPPGSAILYQAGTQALQVYAYAGPVPVVAGVRYWAYCQLVPIRCSACVQVTWRDAAGADLAYSAGTVLPPAVGADVRLEADYAFSDLVMNAPEGAASASFLIVSPTGTAQGVDSGVYALKPFFGPVEHGLMTRPFWNAGTAPTVSTGQIAAGATYEIETYEQTAEITLGMAVSQVTPASRTFGPYPIDTKVILTAQCGIAYGNLSTGAPRPGPVLYLACDVDGVNFPLMSKDGSQSMSYDSAPPAGLNSVAYTHKGHCRFVVDLAAGRTLGNVRAFSRFAFVGQSMVDAGATIITGGLVTVEVTKLR